MKPEPPIAPIVIPMLLRKSLIAFISMLVGIPLVVRVAGYRFREGWALVSAHPRFFIVLVLFPWIFAAIGIADALGRDGIKRWEARRNADKSAEPDEPPPDPGS